MWARVFSGQILEMADRNASLRRSVQNAANYNRSFQENGLKTLERKKNSGASVDELFSDIDNMVDKQKEVPNKRRRL